MIGEGNKEGNAVVEAAIEALIAQTKEFERAIAVLELKADQVRRLGQPRQPGQGAREARSSR